jgi:hypothetical protein
MIRLTWGKSIFGSRSNVAGIRLKPWPPSVKQDEGTFATAPLSEDLMNFKLCYGFPFATATAGRAVAVLSDAP